MNLEDAPARVGIQAMMGSRCLRQGGREPGDRLAADAMRAAGVNARHIDEDTASGKRDDRPGLAACLKALREKDTLVVWNLDRLGRGLRHLVNTVHELTSRGVGFKVLTGHGATIDTTHEGG